MMTANKILAVSFIAMLAVSTANATVVTQTNVVGANGVDVSVPSEGDNAGKVQIKSAPLYGSGGGAATSAAKTATIDGLTSLEEGQIIVVNPTTTTTKDSTAYTLAVNNFPAKPITRNGSAVNTKTLGTYVWTAGRPSVFVYDGTNWAFIGGYDLNTTYSGMTDAEITAGNGTSNRLITPARLKTAIETWAPETDISGKQDIDNMETSTTSFDETSTTKYPSMAVAQAMIDKSADDISDVVNNKQDKLSSGTNGNIVSSGNGNVVTSITASDGTVTVTKGTTLGSLATKSAVASADITDGTIVNADVSNSAAITTNKIGALNSYSKGTSAAALSTSDTLNAALGKLENKADNAAAAAADAAAAAASHTHASQDVTAMTGYAKASTAAAIAATDSLNTAIGKLEKTVDGKVTANSAITAKSGNNLVSYDAKGLVTGSVAAGSLATKSAVASADITDGTIVNADISDSAAIAVSKISGAEASANKVANMSNLATADYTSTTKYPSIKTTVELIEDSADTLSDEISTLSNNKQDKLKSSGDGANVTSSGTGYVVTGVTASDGVVTVSKANVQIPSGSENATTYASIWVE